ncbi:hypothetical protein OUZ56_005760 [Daphnia magna]|uniref:HAT C-terminal dimerisation domain-containing protein n=1 Tax=Daphnia magna TaxID=35525 RepID=A0ABQ9YTN7_9CRUS|nr:hypothetical protein OUZ56_005760 [Daphnia magna]
MNEDYLVNVVFAAHRQQTNGLQMDEKREYEAEETEPIAGDPSKSVKCSRWPQLCAIARELLSIPATSASSKRAFNAGKDVFGIARMSLNPETVEALVCLRSWYRAGLVGELNFEEYFGI